MRRTLEDIAAEEIDRAIGAVPGQELPELQRLVEQRNLARDENPPFGRGESFTNNFAATTASSTDGTQYEGREWDFEDQDWVNKVARSSQMVRCRIVRNINAGVLLPMRLANLAVAPISNNGGAPGYFGGQVDGYTYVAGARGYPVDEFLPAGGVQPNDLFWIVVKGPAKVLTDLAALTGAITEGQKVMAQTAVTSGATTAGRVILQDVTGTATTLANNIQNYVGHAMTAATTTQTNTAILVDVGHW